MRHQWGLSSAKIPNATEALVWAPSLSVFPHPGSALGAAHATWVQGSHSSLC